MTTLGPKIVRQEAPYKRPAPQRRNRDTGIRQSNDGSWAAIRDGKLAETYTGPGARRLAIRAAGSSVVV